MSGFMNDTDELWITLCGILLFCRYRQNLFSFLFFCQFVFFLSDLLFQQSLNRVAPNLAHTFFLRVAIKIQGYDGKKTLINRSAFHTRRHFFSSFFYESVKHFWKKILLSSGMLNITHADTHIYFVTVDNLELWENYLVNSISRNV